MPESNKITATEEFLHAAEVESLERRIMELALERTGAKNGAIFLWNDRAQGLTIDFHMVDGVVVTIPGVILRKRTDRPNGIAMVVHDDNAPYLCHDTSQDPNYAAYFLDVRSVAAVPIPYQQRAIGVITVSSHDLAAFDQLHLDELTALAKSAAPFLRRAQLFRSKGQNRSRPLLIKGLSTEWLEVERQLEQVAPTSAPVLIQGESGTGKELLANAIHFNSLRAEHPLITVNSAAIPETLLESTLFGHVKGAFTGASFTKVGDFKKADGGTLFLDEVGELPLPLQAKLLRAVESGEIQPLGSNAPPQVVDVRLICATHQNLAALVQEGRFRDDLYYRLGVVTIELPALRSYKDNLDILTQVYLVQAARKHGKKVTRVTTEAMAFLRAYDFPGNVRELRNVVEHSVIMAGTDEVLPADLPKNIRSHNDVVLTAPRDHPSARQTEPAGPLLSLKAQRESWLHPLERDYLLDLLSRTNGRVRPAAKLADVNQVTFYRLLKKRGIELKRRFE